MLDGQIHDIQKVGETVSYVKKQLEEKIGRPLKNVCIAAAGRVLKTAIGFGELEFEEETTITTEHIYSLDLAGTEKAQDIYFAIEQYLQNNGVEILFGKECYDIVLDRKSVV